MKRPGKLIRVGRLKIRLHQLETGTWQATCGRLVSIGNTATRAIDGLMDLIWGYEA